MQSVTYDWRPPYCKVCCMVGHNCETKAGVVKKAAVPVKKVTKKWVPKKQQPVVVQSTQAQVVPTQATPVGTSSVIHSDDDAGWRVDSRRVKHREERVPPSTTPVQNVFGVLTQTHHETHDEELDEEEGDGGQFGDHSSPG